MALPVSSEQLAADNADLRERLAEAEEALRAIRDGEVDALVVKGLLTNSRRNTSWPEYTAFLMIGKIFSVWI